MVSVINLDGPKGRGAWVMLSAVVRHLAAPVADPEQPIGDGSDPPDPPAPPPDYIASRFGMGRN